MSMRTPGTAYDAPTQPSLPFPWPQPPHRPHPLARVSTVAAADDTERNHLLDSAHKMASRPPAAHISACIEALPPKDSDKQSSRPPRRRGLGGLMRRALCAVGYSTADEVQVTAQRCRTAIEDELRTLNRSARSEHDFFKCAARVNRRMSALQDLGRYLDSTIGKLIVYDAEVRRALRALIDDCTDTAAQRLQGEYRLAKKMWRDDFKAQVAAAQKGVMPAVDLEREIARLDALVDASLLHTPEQQRVLKQKTARLRYTAGLKTPAGD